MKIGMALPLTLSLAGAAAVPRTLCLLATRGQRTTTLSDTLTKTGEGAVPASAYTDGNLPMPITFSTTTLVASLDLVIYLALPEGERFGTLAKRMPRVAWAVLTIVFSLLNWAGAQPWLVLILGLLLASSAVTDLLWWVPYYAFTAEWEKCSGGFFTRRLCRPHQPWDRWLLFALCLGTGVFYTLSAIHSFGAFQYLRDEESERRMRRSFAEALESGKSHLT
uniref:Uncharacterized protein n=1 Tax=Coccolithus braarudii TaxID=221442 RepID=A0A7S0LRB5_9EUKA|mmetsp:Transcript_505/g.1044  ORF Transcript_505/g.1044 Transcript_505/m.1044 type:complete len:222 (+) Transcript_505:1-666(+)